jgi:molybdenum transport protein
MFFIPDSFIEGLVAEDIGIMDATTDALGIEDEPGAVECFPKRGCVVAGVEETARAFEFAGTKAEIIRKSGSRLAA